MLENIAFTPKTVEEIENYAALWAEQMPKVLGLSFRIQYIQGQYRTIVVGCGGRSDIVCANARDIVDFSELAKTPEEGWSPTLLNKFTHLLRNELTFTATEEIFAQLQKMVQEAESFKQIDTKAMFKLIKRGKFSLNETPKANQHPKLIFDAIKAGKRITVKADGLCIFIKNRTRDDDDE